MRERSSTHVYATLVTNNDYVQAALTLGYSLRRTNTSHCLMLMIVASQVDDSLRHCLEQIYDFVIPVDLLDSNDTHHLELLGRKELGITFTKIHLFRMTQFKKIVFLDADTLVLQNCDGLFNFPSFSACPDAGWPDCFNSGVFVCEPSEHVYQELIDLAAHKGSFDGGDQGLLNEYFRNWNRLSFLYNMTVNTRYSYRPAYERFKDEIKIVHFVGSVKPWSVNAPVDVHFVEWKKFHEKVDEYLNSDQVVLEEFLNDNQDKVEYEEEEKEVDEWISFRSKEPCLKEFIEYKVEWNVNDYLKKKWSSNKNEDFCFGIEEETHDESIVKYSHRKLNEKKVDYSISEKLSNDVSEEDDVSNSIDEENDASKLINDENDSSHSIESIDIPSMAISTSSEKSENTKKKSKKDALQSRLFPVNPLLKKNQNFHQELLETIVE